MFFRRKNSLVPNEVVETKRQQYILNGRMELFLFPLSMEVSVNLILYHTHRELTKEDFGIEEELQQSAKNLM